MSAQKRLNCLIVVGLLFACTINGQWLKTTIPVGDYPCDIAWNSTNNKVYCANVFSDTVTVIMVQRTA